MIALAQLLEFAAQGWHIFPLAPNSKVPPKGSHGVTDATTDAEIIKAWHKACPDANYGVNAGKSGLFIVDFDFYKDGCQAAMASLDLEYGFPPTFTVKTPGGGTHWYYRGIGANSVAKLGPGIDTRGVGKFLLLELLTFESLVQIYELFEFQAYGPSQHVLNYLFYFLLL